MTYAVQIDTRRERANLRIDERRGDSGVEWMVYNHLEDDGKSETTTVKHISFMEWRCDQI